MKASKAYFLPGYNPVILLVLNLLILPFFLLHNSLIIKLGQTTLFALYAVGSGKRISFLYFSILSLAVVLFHLLMPAGKVLFRIATFPVTIGALNAGLLKSLTICGLVFLSVSLVRRDLKIPGIIGRYIATVFSVFDALMTQKKTVNVSKIIESIDNILFSIPLKFDETNTQPSPETPSLHTFPTKKKEVLLPILLLLKHMALWTIARFIM